MTNKEIDLVIMMLDAYSDHLSSAGCNDTPREWLDDFTPDELVEMVRDFHRVNGADMDQVADPNHPLLDFYYVALMQDKLKHMMVF